jgi:hypothetical protein
MKFSFKLSDLLTAKHAAALLITVIAVFYVLIPLVVYFAIVDNILYIKTAGLACVALLGIAVGNKIPRIALNTGTRRRSFQVSKTTLVNCIFVSFFVFIAITVTTADSIPLLSAIQGSTAALLSDERGAFLKGREGGWIALLYLSSMLTSSIVPYAAIAAYHLKSRSRHLLATAFFVYSSIFLVKALFLNLVVPLVSYGVEINPKKSGRVIALAFTSICFLLLMIWLSGYGSLEASGPATAADYFTAGYYPTGVLDFFLYRTFSIPVFSVVDTLHVHSTQLNGDLLWGKTSSLLASLFGAEKINLERLVSSYQYGGWNDFANSNVVFFADGYVNFGWPGVFVFGLVVGKVLRTFRQSEDVALRSLSVLFCVQLFSSPLIQMLLSNGWILILLVATVIKDRTNQQNLQSSSSFQHK